MRIDLHTHTYYSSDSDMSFEAYIEACQRAGLDAVAVTDHNEIEGALALREIAPFPVIVGEEVKTSEGELMAFFIEELVPRGLSPEETIARIRDQGGLVGVSHPMDPLRRSALERPALERIVDHLDFIECFNARCTFSRDNQQAKAFAEAHGLPCSAGSDAHTPRELGGAHVQMDSFETPEAFLDSLAVGQIHGELINPLVHLVTTAAKLKRHLGMR